MEKLFLLFLFFHVSSPVKHSLNFFLARSSGIPNFPEFMVTVEVDDTVLGSCDKDKVEPKHDWGKKFLESDPGYWLWCEFMCFNRQPYVLTRMINILMQGFNQTGGVHILQRMYGCVWDDETGETNCFSNSVHNKEDIFTFDLKTLRWIALKPEAEGIKNIWNDDRAGLKNDELKLTKTFPDLLKEYVNFTNGFLQKTDLPSVFLLQQTPSSPVRCFASGFYPERASLFWRKDGKYFHEDVEHVEILPNTDGTFQMSVDLNISSVTPEDWRRYECVFHLSGVKDDIVTKLDKTAIRTNWEEPSHMTVPIVASVVVLVLILIAAVGFIIYRHRKKVRAPQPSPESSSELSEQLNPTT